MEYKVAEGIEFQLGKMYHFKSLSSDHYMILKEVKESQEDPRIIFNKLDGEEINFPLSFSTSLRLVKYIDLEIQFNKKERDILNKKISFLERYAQSQPNCTKLTTIQKSFVMVSPETSVIDTT